MAVWKLIHPGPNAGEPYKVRSLNCENWKSNIELQILMVSLGLAYGKNYLLNTETYQRTM